MPQGLELEVLLEHLHSLVYRENVGNMDYSCHWCQKNLIDDKGITKDMMEEWTQWKTKERQNSELSISQRKDKGSDDMAWIMKWKIWWHRIT